VTFIYRAGTPGPDGIQLTRAASIISKILKVAKDILLLAERPECKKCKEETPDQGLHISAAEFCTGHCMQHQPQVSSGAMN